MSYDKDSTNVNDRSRIPFASIRISLYRMVLSRLFGQSFDNRAIFIAVT